MYVICCVDNRMGMRFNHRRQSRDRILQDSLLTITAGHVLRMNAESFTLFENCPGIAVSEKFLEEAGQQDFCFVEDPELLPPESEIEGVILCRWNRDYPADQFFPFSLSAWHLQFGEEFPGSSHEKLSVEVYVK